MPATTPVYALRYQELGDAPHGPNLGQNLALDVEAQLVRLDDPTPVGKMVGAGAAQSITHAATNVVDFASSQINLGGMNDLTNNWFNVITPGIYLAVGSFKWAADATGYRSIAIGLNGVDRKRVVQDANTAFGVTTEQDISLVMNLVANDKVTLRVLQTQSPAAALLAEYTLVDSVSLSLHYISPAT